MLQSKRDFFVNSAINNLVEESSLLNELFYSESTHFEILFIIENGVS